MEGRQTIRKRVTVRKCKSYELKEGRIETGNILNGMVRVGFFKKMTFEQGWDRSEGASHASIWWIDPSR